MFGPQLSNGARFKMASLVLAIIAAYLLRFMLGCTGFWPRLGAFVLASIFCLLSLVTYQIATLNPARSHSLVSLFTQYLANVVVRYLGNYFYHYRVPYWGSNAAHIQQCRLLEILSKNCNTVYGKQNKFNEIMTREDYVRAHPLTDYKHYTDYIERMVSGEQDILFSKPVAHIAFSSGTTGKNKLLPLNDSIRKPAMTILFLTAMLKRSNCQLGRVFALRHRPKARRSQTGIMIAPWSYYGAPPIPFFLVPVRAHEIYKQENSLYVQALFGLLDREITLVDGFMSTFLYSFCAVLENNWQKMCVDIELGRLNPDLEIDDVIRIELNGILQPNPTRAEELRQEFSKGFVGLFRRIWPDCRAVHMLATGAFAVYAQNLMQTHTKGLRLLSIPHTASEGVVGYTINQDPDDMRYVILPIANFYEFIEEADIHEPDPQTVFLEQLEVGKQYEVVITTDCGLYRYRLGDVIKVVGHVQNCPAYEFSYRIGQGLNVASEKMPENIFYGAIMQTVADFEGLELRDYTAAESIYLANLTDCPEKCYVLFVELMADGAPVHLTQQQKNAFDESVCQAFENYGVMRSKGSIQLMRVIQIRPGGFLQLKQHMLQSNPTMQFKMPRVLRRKEHLNFLLSQRL